MSTVVHPKKSNWWRIVDWRLVAAVGLPVWAFLFGVMISPRPAPEMVAAPIATPTVEEIPMPRAIVIREVEPVVVTVPIAVPVPGEPVVVVEPAAPPAFQLPDSEILPADKCKQFGTKIRFHDGPVEAAVEAKSAKKMMMVLHISGNFEDPGFT